jgi:hypothetical protein
MENRLKCCLPRSRQDAIVLLGALRLYYIESKNIFSIL